MQRMERVPACSLFLERARAVKPSLQISPTDALAVAEICARLDGLPLAIELAAARTNILTPSALLQRLQRRLDLRSRDADRVQRHRGLREMLDWSYDLLSPVDQRLFRGMAVFAGGASLHQIAAICWDTADDSQVLDRLGTLVDKGLLQIRESTPVSLGSRCSRSSVNTHGNSWSPTSNWRTCVGGTPSSTRGGCGAWTWTSGVPHARVGG